MNKILRPGNAHQKEYLVKVNRPVTPEFLEAMRQGLAGQPELESYL